LADLHRPGRCQSVALSPNTCTSKLKLVSCFVPSLRVIRDTLTHNT
jgi:hypothetical protein